MDFAPAALFRRSKRMTDNSLTAEEAPSDGCATGADPSRRRMSGAEGKSEAPAAGQRSASHQSFHAAKPVRPSASLNDTRRSASAAASPYELVDQINRHDDLYHVLGLSGYSFHNRHQIKLEDIRKAYISRSRLCHPDKLPQYEPCTAAFQKLSAAYETLSKPGSRKLYDLSGTVDPSFNFNSSCASPPPAAAKSHSHRKSNSHFSGRAQQSPNPSSSPSSPPETPSSSSTDNHAFNADETLNGVLHATFCEFMDGDFEMIRVVINALNEGNPGLNLGEEVVTSLESTMGKLRQRLITGQKYLGMVRFELMKLSQTVYFIMFSRALLPLLMLIESSFSMMVMFKRPGNVFPAQAQAKVDGLSPFIVLNKPDQELEHFSSKENIAFGKLEDPKRPGMKNSEKNAGSKGKNQFSITVAQENSESDPKVGDDGKEIKKKEKKDPMKQDIMWQTLMGHTTYCVETAKNELTNFFNEVEKKRESDKSNKSDGQFFANPPYF
ncbi:hypothetical protein PtA15_11A293 [Puccinia triticina]|nr:uncharacterized protein PtA15_11A293 [Puccinia triticina]WAQ89603.1 hypothetical protein PtA15_11A293 [Puccinia triticina]